MATIPIEATPNQTLNINLDDIDYTLTVKTILGITYMSVTADGEPVISLAKVIPNQNVIPYRHLTSNIGNFVFEQEGDNYPNYQDFGDTVLLKYISKVSANA